VEDYWHKSARKAAMKGGFMCRDQGAGGWLLQTSEWLGTKEYSAGPNIGASATNILVFDREHGLRPLRWPLRHPTSQPPPSVATPCIAPEPDP
jgi:hypothetical protein